MTRPLGLLVLLSALCCCLAENVSIASFSCQDQQVIFFFFICFSTLTTNHTYITRAFLNPFKIFLSKPVSFFFCIVFLSHGDAVLNSESIKLQLSYFITLNRLNMWSVSYFNCDFEKIQLMYCLLSWCSYSNLWVIWALHCTTTYVRLKTSQQLKGDWFSQCIWRKFPVSASLFSQYSKETKKKTHCLPGLKPNAMQPVPMHRCSVFNVSFPVAGGAAPH